MVDRKALGEPKNVVLDNHSDLTKFREWSEFGSREDTQIWMQLNHPGKQTPKFLSREPVAPSAIPLGSGLEKVFATLRALSDGEMIEIINKFGTSAKLAKKAGFDGVQIHAAHGYLISQFLSPRHNVRKDKWGGSLENRMRFLLEVYRKIRKEVEDDFPVGIKLNSADFMKSGFSQEDSLHVAKILEEEGIDLIEISGGTYESPSMTGFKVKESTRRREAYFLEYAEYLKQKINIPLVVTGGFRSGIAMQKALTDESTDMIGLARPLAVEPDFPNKILENQEYASFVDHPSTGFSSIDKMAMLAVTWYEAQLSRMAKGKDPKSSLSAWAAVFQTFSRMGVHAFSKRRM